jgi:hypothetical protein
VLLRGSLVGEAVLWCSGALVLWCSGALVLWCSGALVLTVVVLDNYAVKLFGAMILELINPVPTFPAETGHANSKIR